MEGPATGVSGEKKRVSAPNLTLTSELEASPCPHVRNSPRQPRGLTSWPQLPLLSPSNCPRQL